ncbi:hypothetical protein LSAT2_003480 [Lamellibrachia satsuma]|nr:hypothetical protein LSAT2_003480 [Lamellibrachia satsuma]
MLTRVFVLNRAVNEWSPSPKKPHLKVNYHLFCGVCRCCGYIWQIHEFDDASEYCRSVYFCLQKCLLQKTGVTTCVIKGSRYRCAVEQLDRCYFQDNFAVFPRQLCSISKTTLQYFQDNFSDGEN